MKKCLIIVNTHKKRSERLGQEIKDFLAEKNVASDFLNFDGFSSSYPFEKYNFVVTLGGDGTVLYACRGCMPLNIPVFPVNLGEFGFIAGIQKETWKEDLIQYLDNNLPIEKRSMLIVDVIRDSKKVYTETGLNDAVVCAKSVTNMVLLDIGYNNNSIAKFKADGVIISTATGSTAYSASAGGPIIDPELDAMVLTPMNPFSLSARPLVFNPDHELDVKILKSRAKEGILIVDGQQPFDLQVDDLVKIHRAPKKALLIGGTVNKFYNALRNKLNWSGGPHA